MSDERKSKVELILEEWQNDAKWDKDNPGAALIQIPNLHAKYIAYLTKHKLLIKSLENQLAVARRNKYDYYGGRMDQAQLAAKGLQPFKYVLKTELKDYVESDDEILELNVRKSMQETIVELCTAIVKQLGDRTWQLRAYMDWQKFEMGQ